MHFKRIKDVIDGVNGIKTITGRILKLKKYYEDLKIIWLPLVE